MANWPRKRTGTKGEIYEVLSSRDSARRDTAHLARRLAMSQLEATGQVLTMRGEKIGICRTGRVTEVIQCKESVVGEYAESRAGVE